MATTKNRLGRGLGDLISGGIKKDTPNTTPPPPPSVSKIKKKTTKSNKKTTSPKKATTPKVETVVIKEPSEYQEIATSKIKKNPYQPRKEFKPEEIKELADSINAEGLLQPIVLRQKDDHYELIAGERRFRACQSLGLKKIPSRIITASDKSSAVLSLVENLQREGLNPIEESLGYASLLQDFDLTQEAVSERIGKPRATIANSLRLLQLNSEIQGYLSKRLISTGHAKVLLSLEEDTQRALVARQIIEQSLSVRQTEQLVRQSKSSISPKNKANSSNSDRESTIINNLERQIASRLNTKVALKHSPKKGKLIIEYYGNEDLQRILEKTGLV